MKKLAKILFGMSLLTSGVLYASGSHGEHNELEKTKVKNNHMGDHMHEGKMSNHMNKNGMTDEKMKKMSTKAKNNHMGDHMHEGKMTNHMK